MVRQEFSVENYWKVIVYYNISYDFMSYLKKELLRNGFSKEPIKEMFYMLFGEKAKAATCSNVEKHISFVFFNPHDTKVDYLNSVVHEIEHVKQSMLEAYEVEDRGEPPAYTVGYLFGEMWQVFKHIISEEK